MDGGGANKREAAARREGESSGKRQNVTIELETLDCPVCFRPLRPPVYQCSVGHFICSSCHQKLVQNKCHLCSAETTFKHCFGMEQLMESVTVPCSYAIYGCTQRITYYKKEEHEEACPNIPCFCPETGCGFGGPTAILSLCTSGRLQPSNTPRVLSSAYNQAYTFCVPKTSKFCCSTWHKSRLAMPSLSSASNLRL